VGPTRRFWHQTACKDDDLGKLQSIVTSSAQSDSDLFEPNLRDKRYLPFEGAGAISARRLELLNDYRQFEYDTISDVILHLSYTTREGGGALRMDAAAYVGEQIQNAAAAGSARSCRCAKIFHPCGRGSRRRQ